MLNIHILLLDVEFVKLNQLEILAQRI